jgi:hypothetical protein
MVGGFCWILLFLFVPETFWDRTPRPKSRNTSKSISKLTSKSGSKLSLFRHRKPSHPQAAPATDLEKNINNPQDEENERIGNAPLSADLSEPSPAHPPTRSAHVAFAPEDAEVNEVDAEVPKRGNDLPYAGEAPSQVPPTQNPLNTGLLGITPSSLL